MSTDNAPLIENWLFFTDEEQAYTIDQVEGRVPGWLRGSYYLNGPSRFERGGLKYRHWLDGDGMVRALHFREDRVDYASRFVRSRKLMAEEAAGRPIYRTFGTSFPGDELRRGVMLEPPVNVSVYPFGGRLLAFAEQAIPIELDPLSLETVGEFDFNGKLNEVTPFAAHAKFDPETGGMVNFGISFSETHPVLYLYEFTSSGEMTGRRRFPVDAPHSNHDFAISRNFAAFFLSPLQMDFTRFWQEGASVMEALSWQPEKGSYILAVPRVGCDLDAFRVERPSGHCLHLINCFEEADQLIVDVLEFERPIYPEYQPLPEFYPNVDLGKPVRYILDPLRHELVERTEMAYDRAPDFPSVDPRLLGSRYNDFWMLGISVAERPGRKFFDQLAHGSWEAGDVMDVYQAAPGCYLGGEPVFVPKPGDPNTGAIVIQEFDSAADQVKFQVFDAFDVASGPVAQIRLPRKTHPGFHASFRPAGQ